MKDKKVYENCSPNQNKLQKTKEQFRKIKWVSCMREAELRNKINPDSKITADELFEKAWKAYQDFKVIISVCKSDGG